MVADLSKAQASRPAICISKGQAGRATPRPISPSVRPTTWFPEGARYGWTVAVAKALERDQLGLTRAKERIVEYLAVRKLKHDLPGPALCLVGPPGTGKTSLGGAVARALGRPFVRINVSGTTGADELMGVSRT